MTMDAPVKPSAAPRALFESSGVKALLEVLPQADFVALTCPLTPATENLIDARALAAMKGSRSGVMQKVYASIRPLPIITRKAVFKRVKFKKLIFLSSRLREIG